MRGQKDLKLSTPSTVKSSNKAYIRFQGGLIMERKACLICESHVVVEIIDLGNHPFADTFVPPSQQGEGETLYPLVCMLCEACGGIQTKYQTDPLKRYTDIEYSYTSSNSAFSRAHWDEYAETMIKKLSLTSGALVLEAGSNDGYLGEQLLKKGVRYTGIDPSPHMAQLATQRGITTITGLFGQETVRQALASTDKADLIIANNVFNHAEDPQAFMQAVAQSLTDTGAFICEQPYWLTSIETKKFDQIYHEHVSYFTVQSLSKLFERVGMYISSAEVVNYHGGSLRVIAQKKLSSEQEVSEAKAMIQEEQKKGLFKKETYEAFMQTIRTERNNFLQRVCKLKEEGNTIIAVGAAAKGNTFLNFYRLDNSLIEYVTDTSPIKKGKYTPATRIPIVGDEIFVGKSKVCALILSWNLATILKEKLLPLNKDICFISPEERA